MKGNRGRAQKALVIPGHVRESVVSHPGRAEGTCRHRHGKQLSITGVFTPRDFSQKARPVEKRKDRIDDFEVDLNKIKNKGLAGDRGRGPGYCD